MRHGEAVASARSDAERPLTAHGQDEARRSAEHLRTRPLQRILVSPYLRAQQTAELVRQSLQSDLPLTTLDWLTPDDDPRDVARQLDPFEGGEVLVVSHNPLLGALVGFLVHGHLELPASMRTASLAALDGDLILPGAMQLSALYHP